MNKLEFIDAIATATNVTKKQVAQIIDEATSIIMDRVSKDDEVWIVGFGKFGASERKERSGRDPRSGKTITIPARKVVKFSAGKEFKDAVNSVAEEIA